MALIYIRIFHKLSSFFSIQNSTSPGEVLLQWHKVKTSLLGSEMAPWVPSSVVHTQFSEIYLTYHFLHLISLSFPWPLDEFQISLPSEERRDAEKLYNRMTIAELEVFTGLLTIILVIMNWVVVDFRFPCPGKSGETMKNSITEWLSGSCRYFVDQTVNSTGFCTTANAKLQYLLAL